MVMSGYEFDNINIIPSMFAELHKAPPVDIFSDMYGNNISFEEATKNLYDKEMETDYGTDLFDEFFAESGDAMGDPSLDLLDSDDVDTALYQISVAQSQGMGESIPEGIMTPFGPGLTQDRIDELIDEFPGIEAMDDWRGADDQINDAGRFLDNIGASQGIDNLMDGAKTVAEDTGVIGRIK